ncbi:hypothetical protein [Bergeyella cardium]|uniref:Uncharacterized protein n=1 Tax=Bergeyella cardium TaxID=1585976 RepID=A0A6P1QSZ0_9FLAO|nr:hypothetical protein [Bergeyella cardium]QHN64598.1 hypothetical protein DBX24_01160 [Bergeyella cardium]WHE33891.1 hypothetical protein P8603_01160 [Bergeyella cardium]WHF60541.1 hypothetical protein O0R51_01160 [Bergeyella cardium]
MKERLIKFLEYLKIGQNKFAQNVGLSPSFINNLGDGINLKSLQKILKVYPQLNERWLLTGEGDMIRELTQIAKGNGSINSNISGNVEGNVIISHNDFSNMLEVQKGNLEIQKELNDRLKTSQEQVNILLEILQKKEL